MPLTRRYTPEIHPSESSIIGMSFEYVIPPGVGIKSGSVAVLYNQVIGAPSSLPPAATLLLLGPVSIRGRVLYAPITATPEANALDFQIEWNANDTQGNVWWRTALLLCSPTS